MYDDSVIYYDGDHSVIFDGLDSWEVFHLIPLSLPIPPMPERKTNTLDVPGMDGNIDISNILTGYPTYQNRNGSLEFMIAPGYNNFMELYSAVANYLHGKHRKMIFSDDPEWEYEGDFTVTSSQNGIWNNITISYIVKPYKTRLLPVSVLYPDVFAAVSIDSPTYVDIYPTLSDYLMEMPSPLAMSIVSDSGIAVKYWNSDYNLLIEKDKAPTGVYIDPDFVVGKYTLDANIGLQAKGTGRIRIDFTQGRL